VCISSSASLPKFALQPDAQAGQSELDLTIEGTVRQRRTLMEGVVVFQDKIIDTVVGEEVEADRNLEVTDAFDLLLDADLPIMRLGLS